MRNLFLFFLLLPFITNAQYKLFGNGGYNINDNIFYIINNGDSIARFGNASIKFFKPVYLISQPYTIADFYTDANNSGTSATDLYSQTILANTLNNNGEKLKFEVGGDFNDITATCKLDFDFDGNAAGSTGTLTINATGSWKAECLLIRTGGSTARVITTFLTPGAAVTSEESRVNLTGLNWANPLIFKIYGTAGGAGGGSNDITAGLGTILFIPKAL